MSITRLASRPIPSKYAASIMHLGKRLLSVQRRKFNVYAPLKSRLCHPTFDVFYAHPPIPYSIYLPKCISHCINYIPYWQILTSRLYSPAFVVEFVDHPASLLNSFGHNHEISSFRASELIKSTTGRMRDLGIKGFIFQHIRQKEFFDFLYPFLSSCPYVIAPLAFPKYCEAHIQTRANSGPCTFLCIATDFYAKGLPLLLKAWSLLSDTHKNGCSLVIVTPEVPREYYSYLTHSSISLRILKRKLSLSEKINLYQNCDCFVNLALTDSGISAEALSFGLPIISTKLLSTDMYVDNNNGFVLNTPLTFYGTEPLSFYSSYEKFLASYHKLLENGGFNDLILSIRDSIIKALNKDLLSTMSINSLSKYNKNFCAHVRNNRVLQFYNNVISGKML